MLSILKCFERSWQRLIVRVNKVAVTTTQVYSITMYPTNWCQKSVVCILDKTIYEDWDSKNRQNVFLSTAESNYH